MIEFLSSSQHLKIQQVPSPSSIDSSHFYHQTELPSLCPTPPTAQTKVKLIDCVSLNLPWFPKPVSEYYPCRDASTPTSTLTERRYAEKCSQIVLLCVVSQKIRNVRKSAGHVCAVCGDKVCLITLKIVITTFPRTKLSEQIVFARSTNKHS